MTDNIILMITAFAACASSFLSAISIYLVIKSQRPYFYIKIKKETCYYHSTYIMNGEKKISPLIRFIVKNKSGVSSEISNIFLKCKTFDNQIKFFFCPKKIRKHQFENLSYNKNIQIDNSILIQTIPIKVEPFSSLDCFCIFPTFKYDDYKWCRVYYNSPHQMYLTRDKRLKLKFEMQ